MRTELTQAAAPVQPKSMGTSKDNTPSVRTTRSDRGMAVFKSPRRKFGLQPPDLIHRPGLLYRAKEPFVFG